jgi:ankyrin repeat protein
MLIEHGAEVTSQNKVGSNPLHLVSTPLYWTPESLQRYAEVAQILLEHGADVTAQNKRGLTPLFLASQCAEVARVLLQHSADPETHDDMD